MKTALEIIELLNTVDENVNLEVKTGSEIDKSIMETVNSFSNEPNMDGGLIVLGISRDENSLFPSYVVTGIDNPDKLQADIASQAASIFNFPVRPNMEVENINGKIIIKIEVAELSEKRKPLYFQNKGVPKGIYRRIGSTDQRCTEEDLSVFYNDNTDKFDASILQDCSLEDLNEDSIELYRKNLRKANPNSDLLEYENIDLLYAIKAIVKEKDIWKVTLNGLLVFGKKSALRRILPMCRVDYIRVSGTEWVEDADERFESTIDMRGSLLELLPRVIAAIADDLPKGFYLPEGSLQSKTESGLPYKVLREAIVNAFIHRSYKVDSPIQIIRYSNRIEILNAGFSLKAIETIGEPGSLPRNPHISAIFHDTNLAETKGTGIKSMRKLLAKSQMMLPTFDSSHSANTFTLRLLLHHLINEKDHSWLALFDKFQLNDDQKTALIFIREVGALDNQAYRQLTGVNLLQSSLDLRKLVKENVLLQKGSSKKNTYYIPGKEFIYMVSGGTLEKHMQTITDSFEITRNTADTQENSKDAFDKKNVLDGNLNSINGNLDAINGNLPVLSKDLQQKIKNLGTRVKPENMEELILELCAHQSYKTSEIAQILGRNESYIAEKFLNKLLKEGKLIFNIPEVVHHPQQSYKTNRNEENEK